MYHAARAGAAARTRILNRFNRVQNLIAVAVGGALGSVLRYGVGVALDGARFALATLIVNVVGCFLLGCLMHGAVAGNARLALLAHPGVTVGLLGGLTTFSTFGYQTVNYLDNGHWRLALLNVAANLLLGLAAAWAGIEASRFFSDANV